MKFSLAWLKQYLETGASAQEISAKLNALGIEVEGLEILLEPRERELHARAPTPADSVGWSRNEKP